MVLIAAQLQRHCGVAAAHSLVRHLDYLRGWTNYKIKPAMFALISYQDALRLTCAQGMVVGHAHRPSHY